MRRFPLLIALAVAAASAAVPQTLAGQRPLAGQPPASRSLEDQRRALEALTAQEDALADRIGADRNTLAHLLGALEEFSRDPPPPLLVSPTDARDAVRAMILAKALAPQLEARARALTAEAANLKRLRQQADQASGDLFAAESAIDDRQGRLDAVTGDADLMAPPPIRSTAGSQEALPTPKVLLSPADGQVSANFGGRLQSGLAAEGLAYRTGAGAAVRSPADAVVAYAGPLNGWGQIVILRAGGGCHMVLSGLGKVTVVAGQSVAAGTQLGAMPSDGQSPPELYFEVRLAGGPIDPRPLMNKARGTNLNAGALRLRREGVE